MTKKKPTEIDVNILYGYETAIKTIRLRLVAQDKITPQENMALEQAQMYLNQAWVSMQDRLVLWGKEKNKV